MDKKNPIQTVKVDTIPKASEDDFQKLLEAREAIDCGLRDKAPPTELPKEIHSEYHKSNDDIEKTFSEKELNREITIEPTKKEKTYTSYIVLQLGGNVIKHCIGFFRKDFDISDIILQKGVTYELIPIHNDVVFQLPKTLAIPETTNGAKNIVFPNPFYVEFMDENSDMVSNIFLGSQAESYNAELDEDRKTYDYSSKMYPLRVRISLDNKNYLVFQYLPDKHQIQFLSGKVVAELSGGEDFSKTQDLGFNTQDSGFNRNGVF